MGLLSVPPAGRRCSRESVAKREKERERERDLAINSEDGKTKGM